MDSIFSSSFSTISSPLPPLLSPLSPFRVQSVPIKEKPRTITTTTKMSRTQEQRKKTRMNEKHIRSVMENQSLPAKFFKAFDDIITNFIDPPLRDAIDPKHVLSDNFFPVDELSPTECMVSEGTLPSCLDGVYLRNGPNPQFPPQGPYHLFDGDGMVHALRISKGKVTLCSRYVKTSKYNMEKDASFPIVPNVIAGFNGLTASMARMAVLSGRFLVGQFDPTKDLGLANTNLVLFGNKLYALWESDLPYALKLAPDGDIITVGRHDFDGKLLTSMTAHPKIDPITKEAFAFRYGPTRPFLTFFRFNENGEKQIDVPIFSMTSPSFLHDFSITKNYAIFSENQIRMSMVAMMGGGSLFTPDPRKIPRVGVIPRYAKVESEIKWFEVPGWNNIHSINAWEEDNGDTVVMLAPNMLSVEHTLERMNLIHASVEKMTINLKTGMVSRHPLSTRNLDFVVFNPAFVAVKNRLVA